MNTTIENKIQNDRSWEKIIMKYNRPDMRKSIWQIINSVIPYVALWYIMVQSLQYPYWVTLLLAVPAAGFLVRIFIIFHDCGHGSFFKTQKTNDFVGKIMGIMVLTPYSPWHYSHKLHHASAGNLDKRGDGDVWTLTVDEFRNGSKKLRLKYRLYRNPWIMLIFGAIQMVFIKNRFTRKEMDKKSKHSIYFTNIVLAVLITLISLLIGFKAFLLIQLPIILISHIAGIWLFYVQHQFDDVYWDKGQQWDYKSAAIEGSSFLKLPVVLQWFTGNIGFHHIHHLSPKIPNYNLERCHYENDYFSDIPPITLFASVKALNLRLWDTVSRRMLTFRQSRALLHAV